MKLKSFICTSYHMSPPPSHEPEIQTSRTSEESEQLRNLLDLVPKLESRVESLEKELSDHKQDSWKTASPKAEYRRDHKDPLVAKDLQKETQIYSNFYQEESNRREGKDSNDLKKTFKQKSSIKESREQELQEASRFRGSLRLQATRIAKDKDNFILMRLLARRLVEQEEKLQKSTCT
ncbi:hypothetical protein Tco_1377415 [Tanacetum coccineum]